MAQGIEIRRCVFVALLQTNLCPSPTYLNNSSLLRLRVASRSVYAQAAEPLRFLHKLEDDLRLTHLRIRNFLKYIGAVKSLLQKQRRALRASVARQGEIVFSANIVRFERLLQKQRQALGDSFARQGEIEQSLCAFAIKKWKQLTRSPVYLAHTQRAFHS